MRLETVSLNDAWLECLKNDAMSHRNQDDRSEVTDEEIEAEVTREKEVIDELVKRLGAVASAGGDAKAEDHGAGDWLRSMASWCNDVADEADRLEAVKAESRKPKLRTVSGRDDTEAGVDR